MINRDPPKGARVLGRSKSLGRMPKPGKCCRILGKDADGPILCSEPVRQEPGARMCKSHRGDEDRCAKCDGPCTLKGACSWKV